MQVHEDSSTESTKQFASAVGFGKKSIHESIKFARTIVDNYTSQHEIFYKQICNYRDQFFGHCELYSPDSPYNKVKNMVIKASYELDGSSKLLTLSNSATALKNLLSLRGKVAAETNPSPQMLSELDEILKKGARYDFELIQNRKQLEEICAANKDNISSEVIMIKILLNHYSSRAEFTQKEKADWSSYYKITEECLSKKDEEQSIDVLLLYSIYLENLIKIENTIDLFFEHHNLHKVTKLYEEPSISKIRQKLKGLDKNELEQTIQDLHASIRPLRKLADACEIRHPSETKSQSGQLAHEDSRTDLMPNFVESVEFQDQFWKNTPQKVATEQDNKNLENNNSETLQQSHSSFFYKATANFTSIFKNPENNNNVHKKNGFY